MDSHFLFGSKEKEWIDPSGHLFHWVGEITSKSMK
jgi:hypothetical protein